MGSYLSSPVTEKETERGEVPGSDCMYATCSMQGWRTSQEDAYLVHLYDMGDLGGGNGPGKKNGIVSQISLFGVFDGHGGHEVAHFAAERLPSTLASCEKFKCKEYGPAFIDAFLKLDADIITDEGQSKLRLLLQENQNDTSNNAGCQGQKNDEIANEIMKQFKDARDASVLSDYIRGVVDRSSGSACADELGAQSEPEEDLKTGCGYQSGCTANCFLLVGNEKLIVANAGDTRCVLSRRGVAVDLSKDHKPENKEELQRIEAAGGCLSVDNRVNGNLNLSRAFGDFMYKQNSTLPAERQIITAMPEIQEVSLVGDEDFVIIACDGVWGPITSQEAVDFIIERRSKGTSCGEIVEQLCDHCMAPLLEDNTVNMEREGMDNITVVLLYFPEKVQHCEKIYRQQY